MSIRRVGRIILPAGKATRPNEELSDDFATQLRQALANVKTEKRRTRRCVDHSKERFRVMTEEVKRVWGDNKPASTLIPVRALALEGMLVEIDVIAVVPA